jgi:hypothetical protein
LTLVPSSFRAARAIDGSAIAAAAAAPANRDTQAGPEHGPGHPESTADAVPALWQGLRVWALEPVNSVAVVQLPTDELIVVRPGDSIGANAWVALVLPDRLELVLSAGSEDVDEWARRAWIYRADAPDRPSRVVMIDRAAPARPSRVAPHSFMAAPEEPLQGSGHEPHRKATPPQATGGKVTVPLATPEKTDGRAP